MEIREELVWQTLNPNSAWALFATGFLVPVKSLRARTKPISSLDWVELTRSPFCIKSRHKTFTKEQFLPSYLRTTFDLVGRAAS